MRKTPHGVRATALLFLLLLLQQVFSGCARSSTAAYLAEAPIGTHAADGELAAELCGLTRLFCTRYGDVADYDGSSASVSLRGEILTYLLYTGYARYAGNTGLIAAAETEYPNYHMTTVIPAFDYENTVYTYFGGTQKITNGSTGVFTYLPKAGVYVPAAQPGEYLYTAVAVSLTETENTYRLEFYNICGTERTERYRAVFVKRDDGSKYIVSVGSVGDSAIAAPSA